MKAVIFRERFFRGARTIGVAALSCLVLTGTAARAADDGEKSDAAARAQLEHGSYMVHRVAMCVQCHSAREMTGDLAAHKLLKGSVMPLNSPFPYQVWAMSAPQIVGLPAGYTEDEMATLLEKGIAKNGRTLRRPMPPYRMTEMDARAIAAYLKWAGTQTDVVDISVPERPALRQALAVLTPVEKSGVSGIVELTEEDGLVMIRARIAGLKPGLHGFHILSKDAHWNPTDQEHGGPEDTIHHLGDLGNIVADEKGVAYYERADERFSFDGKHSVIGLTIAVDENADDLATQPDGNSGAALATGVIKKQ